MPGTFSPSPRVSDPDMHHGTCVTHVPWCMPGSLTSSFLWSRWREKTLPASPAHAQPAILHIRQEVHGLVWQIPDPEVAQTLMTRIHSYGSLDDVIKWKHLPRYWPFVRGIHRSPVNSPHKGQWSGALMSSFTCAWIKGWVNNLEARDLRCHCAHYDVIVMQSRYTCTWGDIRVISPLWKHSCILTVKSHDLQQHAYDNKKHQSSPLIDGFPWQKG